MPGDPSNELAPILNPLNEAQRGCDPTAGPVLCCRAGSGQDEGAHSSHRLVIKAEDASPHDPGRNVHEQGAARCAVASSNCWESPAVPVIGTFHGIAIGSCVCIA